jgi:hypothetical protein
VVSTRDVRLIVNGNEIGIGVAKYVGRACNRLVGQCTLSRRAFRPRNSRALPRNPRPSIGISELSLLWGVGTIPMLIHGSDLEIENFELMKSGEGETLEFIE